MLPPQRVTSQCWNHNSEGEHYVKLQTCFLVTSALLEKHLLLHCPLPSHAPLHSSALFLFFALAVKISVICNHLNDFNKKEKLSSKTTTTHISVVLFRLLRGFFQYMLVLCEVCLFNTQKERRRNSA